MARSYSKYMFNFLRNCQPFFHFIFPPAVYGSSSFSRTLSTLLHFSHLNVCSDTSLWFSFAFPEWLMMSSIFLCVYLPSVYLLGEGCVQNFSCVFSFFFSFYYWILRILYIFWIEVPYQMCHSKIFASSLWLLFSF